MTVLPLTILMHEGPQGRAYLSALKNAGYRPARIILMVYTHDHASGKPIGPWAPFFLRRQFAQSHQNRTQLYWVRHIRKRMPALYAAMVETIGDALDLPADFFEQTLGDLPLSDYAETVEKVMVKDFRDPKLAKTLQQVAPATLLFTGGGLVPKELLSLESIRVLHIHPGLLPHVRGADGLLWSMLVRGRPGASCFYMTPGLDEGDVALAQEFEPIKIPLSNDERPDDQTLYRAIFSFLDPAIRARLLLSLIEKGGNLNNLPAQRQDRTEGVTYHFMNPAFRRLALDAIFPRTEISLAA